MKIGASVKQTDGEPFTVACISINPSTHQPTNQLTNQSIHQPISLSTHQPPTHQPTNSSIHQLINSATHQLINQSTHQPINSSTHQPINQSPPSTYPPSKNSLTSKTLSGSPFLSTAPMRALKQYTSISTPCIPHSSNRASARSTSPAFPHIYVKQDRATNIQTKKFHHEKSVAGRILLLLLLQLLSFFYLHHDIFHRGCAFSFLKNVFWEFWRGIEQFHHVKKTTKTRVHLYRIMRRGLGLRAVSCARTRFKSRLE